MHEGDTPPASTIAAALTRFEQRSRRHSSIRQLRPVSRPRLSCVRSSPARPTFSAPPSRPTVTPNDTRRRLSANSRSSSGLVMTRLSRTNSDFGTCLTSTQCDLMCAGTLHGPAKSVQNSDVSVLLSSRLFARLNREVHRNNRDHCQDDHVDRNRPGLRLELRHQPGGDQRRQGAREN